MDNDKSVQAQNDLDLSKILHNATVWAREAGRIQMDLFQSTGLEISSKSSQVDLVTEADKASEEYILSRIRGAYPDHSILSEESGENDKSSDYQWVVDPLDGTTNFAQGLPIFAVSIALTKNGESVVGVVYCPVLDAMYTAVTGQGAFLNDKRLKVSEKKTLDACVLASGFPYFRAKTDDNNSRHFAHMVPKVRGLRRMGAAAFDLANVAAGTLDGYWEMGLGPWDAAAGVLLVKEAGGVVMEWPGKANLAIVAGPRIIVEQIAEELLACEQML